MKNEETKTSVTMIGRTRGPDACTHCISQDEYWRAQPVAYRYISVDGKEGKKWLARHNISEIPVSRVCTTTENGKKSCETLVGTSVLTKQGRKKTADTAPSGKKK